MPHEMVGFLSYPAGAAHAFVGVTVFPDMAGSLAASTVELTRVAGPKHAELTVRDTGVTSGTPQGFGAAVRYRSQPHRCTNSRSVSSGSRPVCRLEQGPR